MLFCSTSLAFKAFSRVLRKNMIFWDFFTSPLPRHRSIPKFSHSLRIRLCKRKIRFKSVFSFLLLRFSADLKISGKRAKTNPFHNELIIGSRCGWLCTEDYAVKVWIWIWRQTDGGRCGKIELFGVFKACRTIWKQNFAGMMRTESAGDSGKGKICFEQRWEERENSNSLRETLGTVTRSKFYLKNTKKWWKREILL